MPATRYSFLAAAALLLTGCTTLKRTAVNQLGDALAGGGTVFSADDDPELIKAAAPFSLKLMESLLAQSPNHTGLLLAASSGFTQYAYAFVQQEADEIEDEEFSAATEMRARARQLYLRARDYGLRGLDSVHGGFSAQLRRDPAAAMRSLRRADVALAYWTAASWGAAISLSKDNPALIVDLPLVEHLVDRALELDEGFDQGSIHTFLIAYEMARATGAGDPATRARSHFERALSLSRGRLAAPYVSLAEAVCLPAQDAGRFEDLLRRALAIDPAADPASRLANAVMQRRARWLLSRRDQLFLEFSILDSRFSIADAEPSPAQRIESPNRESRIENQK